MKNKKLIITLLLFTFYLLPAVLHSAFVDLGTGARPLGMGNAFVAVADEANTTLYNPAGLAQLTREEVTLTYSKLYVGIDGLSNSFASYEYPLSKRYGSFGIGWYNFVTKDLYNENTVLLSYGHQLLGELPVLSGGINLKYLAKKYVANEWTAINPVFAGGTSASGISLDLGFLCQINKPLSIGFSVENLNQPDISLQSTDKVPLGYRVGAAYKLDVLGPLSGFTATLEDSNIAQTNSIRAGLEAWFMERTLATRLGFSNRDISLGAGYIFKLRDSEGELDYAFISPFNFVDAVSGTHRISLGLRFGSILEDEEEGSAEETEEEEEGTEEAQSTQTEKSTAITSETPVTTTPGVSKSVKQLARTAYLDAVKLYNKNKFLKAYDKFNYVLKLDPKDRISPRYISRMRGNVERTVNKFKKEKDLQYAVGYLSYVDNKINVAVTVWEKLLIIDPTNEEVKEYLKKYKTGSGQAQSVEQKPVEVAPATPVTVPAEVKPAETKPVEVKP